MTLKLLMTESLNGVTVVKKGLLEIRAARRGGRQSRTMQNRYRAAYYSPLCFYTSKSSLVEIRTKPWGHSLFPPTALGFKTASRINA